MHCLVPLLLYCIVFFLNSTSSITADFEEEALIQQQTNSDEEEVEEVLNTRVFLKSIIKMPSHMWRLCLANAFSWSALVTYSSYFTDLVGQAVYGGEQTLIVVVID